MIKYVDCSTVNSVNSETLNAGDTCIIVGVGSAACTGDIVNELAIKTETSLVVLTGKRAGTQFFSSYKIVKKNFNIVDA